MRREGKQETRTPSTVQLAQQNPSSPDRPGDETLELTLAFCDDCRLVRVVAQDQHVPVPQPAPHQGEASSTAQGVLPTAQPLVATNT